MKCPKLKKIKLQNGAVKLECLEDKGNDKYKVGCYIWGDLLSTKVLRVEKLEEWANSRKRRFSHDISIILRLIDLLLLQLAANQFVRGIKKYYLYKIYKYYYEISIIKLVWLQVVL